MAHRHHCHTRKLLVGWAMVALPLSARAELPPPMVADGAEALRLRLELVVNGEATGAIVPVEARDGTWRVDAQNLRAVHVQLDPAITGLVAMDSLPQVHAAYDEAAQRLLLTVPAEWLPHQSLGRLRSDRRLQPESSFGAVLNYDLYASRSGRGQSFASLWNEARVFGGFGLLRTTSTYHRSLSGAGNDRFTRFDTGWTYVDEERVRTYEAGDLVTRTLPSATPVRLGGVQVSRDFAVRPDIVTYPLPSFSGTASVPTAVELFINGHQAAEDMLQPGPFTLNGMPYVTGSGEAVIVTTDVQGRRVSTNVPFYVASTLLRPGLSDFAFSVGKLRRHYGLRNASYGAAAASGAWRQGVAEWLTVEAQAQMAGSLTLAGAGGTVRLGRFGVVDLSATSSRYQDQPGFQLAGGYQYSGRRVNLMVRHVRRDPDFTDLGGYGTPEFRPPRRETQANASVVLGQDLGTLGASYIETRWRDDAFRFVGLSYAKPLWQRGTLLLSANRDLERRRTSAMLQLVLSLGEGGTASAALEQDGASQWRKRINYSRSVPTDGGLGWNAALAHGGRRGVQYQGDVTWRTPGIQLQAGAYGGAEHESVWGSASGSLVLMDGGMFAANRINDAFVVVSTDGVPGVPVRQENQRVGVTDKGGRLLIPWVNAFYGAKFEIDPLDLPPDVSTPVVEQRAAVRLGAGRVVRFPVRRTLSVTFILNDRHGQPLAAGAPVATDSGLSSYVGWGGLVYLEGVASSERVTAEMPDGERCAAAFTLPESEARSTRIGPLTCK